jgi:hypothetical protein
MTPESRAKEIAEALCAVLARAEAAYDKRGWVEMPKADRKRYVERAMLAAPLILQAIASAEDNKLEQAARLCDGITESPRDGLRQTHASPYFARQIRNLKTEKAP